MPCLPDSIQSRSKLCFFKTSHKLPKTRPPLSFFNFSFDVVRLFSLYWICYHIASVFFFLLLCFGFWLQDRWDLSFPNQGANPHHLLWKAKSHPLDQQGSPKPKSFNIPFLSPTYLCGPQFLHCVCSPSLQRIINSNCSTTNVFLLVFSWEASKYHTTLNLMTKQNRRLKCIYYNNPTCYYF